MTFIPLASRPTYTGPVAEDHDETVDVLALFDEPKRPRHSWGPQKFSGSFVSSSRVSACACGVERHRQYNYGDHRTIFKAKDGHWHERTPPCSTPTRDQA